MSTKTAIVTGGNSGLGFATAKKLCDNGIITYIIGRSKEKTEEACAEIGANAIPVLYDLNDIAGIPAMIEKIAKNNPIDILVNNAGINLKKEFLEVTDEDFLSVIHTNLLSVFAVSREVVKTMKENKGGSIVNISSMASQYGIPKVIAYSASKGAIESMTRAMAVELAPFGIRVNCIAPGFIKTKMSSTALDNDPERKNKVLSRTPMGFLGEPSDIADAVFYFALNESKYTTGTVLPVDGGNSIGF
ncbi:3-oxoacyl-ACP reductase [Flavobacterium aquidurense]|jgi:NAD(P)-dependent dehydrogenase (short-subunit alcohol dehydrogenase family)|uniref:SDR family NAD(P)-dependent oxidoreductase n=1 Tax=Flavobacterium aquidurense TaxID=362413 RepID=UPI000918B4FE|nr:SDR family oxidoreductase [Flavobacterium aquidurense]OXA65989.1 3-oxoacyl-ACP reductase [Flavobacterium aquidurense]SHH82108.1 NAD(P)-dependent dehydrogenase, short-chain alcohol dehydrogenase family [Flavobacterium frigidimaris]